MGSYLPDEDLARRAAEGHTEDFEELLQRYRTRIYRLCYRMAGNAEDAEDWAQECFVRCYRQLGSYKTAMPFAPWFLRVASNTCINLAKSRNVRWGRLNTEMKEEDKLEAPHSDPMQIALSGEETERIRCAVAALPPPLRQAISLRILEELSFKELASALGVPLQTAASRVRRAMAMVRARLESSEGRVSDEV